MLAGHGNTRTKGLVAARDALGARGYDFVQSKFHGDVFIIGGDRPVTVRPKISSGKFEGDSWPWDLPPTAREDFYLFVLDKKGKRPKFWIVPSAFVRGALEGNHHGWYLARNEEAKIAAEPMRVLQPWMIREFEGRWDLLGSPKK